MEELKFDMEVLYSSLNMQVQVHSVVNRQRAARIVFTINVVFFQSPSHSLSSKYLEISNIPVHRQI